MLRHVKRKMLVCKNCKNYFLDECLLVEKKHVDGINSTSKSFEHCEIPVSCPNWTDFLSKDTIKHKYTPKHEEVERVIETVTCLDNSGMEEHFEQGVKYIFKENIGKDGMIIVEDMLGEDITVLESRFETDDE